MKRELKLLFEEAGKRARERKEGKESHGHSDFEQLSAKLVRHHVNLSGASLKKLWQLVTGKRKLSLAAKNRLALFAGFQSWNDLDEALHGDADANKNFEV